MSEPNIWETDAAERIAELEAEVAEYAEAMSRANAKIEELRHALRNVAENMHAAGLVSDIARDDILRAAS